MPNWRKVITSGSNAQLNSLTASAGIRVTGSVDIKSTNQEAFRVGTSYTDPILIISSSGLFNIGDSTFGRSINGTTRYARMLSISDVPTVNSGYYSNRIADTCSLGCGFIGLRARGSLGAETIVQDGDPLATYGVAGYDGSDYAFAGIMQFEVDGTPGTDSMPSRWVLAVARSGSQAPQESIRVNNLGYVGINNSNPLYTLDVSGSMRIVGSLINSSSVSNTHITGSFTGSFNGNTTINLVHTSSFHGETIIGQLGEAVVPGRLLFLSSSKQWFKVKAFGSQAARMLSISTVSGSATDNISLLTRGACKYPSFIDLSSNYGAQMYMSMGTGSFQSTPPSGSNEIVRIIGYVSSENTLFFNPDPTFVKLT